MQPVLAFIDESGDPSLDTEKQGVSTHFIVVAVMVEPTQLSLLASATERVRKKFFQTGEMKSSSVGKNWSRRMRILREVGGFEFKAHVLVVDKARVWRESGLQYKRSFIKYVHGLLYSRLYRAIPDLVVVTDEHGSHEFMEGFRRYVRTRHVPDLFTPEADIRFENSNSQPLVQLADIIAGSLGHAMQGGSKAVDEVLRAIAGRILTYAEWPPIGRAVPIAPKGEDAQADLLIRRHCFNLANVFLSKNAGDESEDVRCQIETLRYLYFHSEFISDAEYVNTSVLRGHLADALAVELTVHAFRSRVVGPLRDAGVLLASGSSGYKLPISGADIRSFVNHGASIIGPLLERLRRAQEEILVVTNGRVDIFDGEGLEYLRRRRDV